MKINIVVPTTLFGGGMKMIVEYANFFANSGHDVIIYIPIIYKNITRKVNMKTSIANSLLRSSNIEWATCIFVTKKAIINDCFIRDADITIATAPSTAYDVSRLSLKKGKKVYFIQGHELNEDGSNLEYLDSTYKLGMNLIVINSWMKNYLKTNYNLNSNLIYNGIKDTEYIKKDEIVHNNRKKTIIMLGNTAHYKGGRSGIRILKNIQKKYNVEVILYGLHDIEELPATFQFYKNPDRDFLLNLYKTSDICLFPSISEGWGLIVTEAMANGCAIVGNNTGCVRELCTNKKNALISESFNEKELEKYIEILLNDEIVLNEMKMNAYNLSLDIKQSRQNSKFEKYLLELIGEM